MTTSKRLAWVLAIFLSFSLIAAACGDDDSGDGGTSDNGAADGGGDLSGSIDISGSSTVEPISVRVQELFNEGNPNVNITVDGPGTGDGFQLFCGGETDISDASRQIKDEEAQTCADNGIDYVELQVGIDGIAAMTSANSDVSCVSFEQMYGLVGPESDGLGNWADANALITEIGGEGNLPDASLDIFGPGEESGTFDSFIEIVLEDIAEERGQEPLTRVDYNASADDNVIIQGLQGSESSFGWVGFAFAENASDVKLLEVDGGEGCVAANADTIASNVYPVSRPLFIYVNAAKAAEKPELVAFVDFYVETGLDQAASEVGYVALADDAKQAVRDAWNAR